MNNVTPAVADIAANATASIAGRAAQAVQTAIASNPMVAGAVAATLGIATAGAVVYFGGQFAINTATAGFTSARAWFRSSDPVYTVKPQPAPLSSDGPEVPRPGE